MGMAKINTLRRLHQTVIHDKVWKGPEGQDLYRLEDTEIKKVVSDIVLAMICPKCFPNTEKRPKYPPRSVETFDKFYPKINEVIW